MWLRNIEGQAPEFETTIWPWTKGTFWWQGGWDQSFVILILISWVQKKSHHSLLSVFKFYAIFFLPTSYCTYTSVDFSSYLMHSWFLFLIKMLFIKTLHSPRFLVFCLALLHVTELKRRGRTGWWQRNWGSGTRNNLYKVTWLELSL